MKKILISIKPEFVKEIFSGRKKFEYRKVIFLDKSVKQVVVYSTMPEGKLIGEFTIEEILQDKPNNIWAKTHNHSGISKEFFDSYFDGRSSAYAIRIGKLKIYKNPLDPKELWDSFVAPQSFKYLDESLY